MATIRKYVGTRGTRFTAQIRRHGHTEFKSFSRKTDAKEWAARRELELTDAPHLAGATKHTLAEAIDRYLTGVLPTKSASMLRSQTHQLAWWRAEYGQFFLGHFTPAVLSDARDRLSATPYVDRAGQQKRRSSATVNRYMSAVSGVLNLAFREWQWLPGINPMASIRPLKEPIGRSRLLTMQGDDSELVRLLRGCQDSSAPDLYLIVWLALTTAGRYAEILGLRWADIDFAARTVTFTGTKNNTQRTVGLDARALDLLAARRGSGAALVFPAPSDPRRPVAIRSSWRNVTRRAGLNDFHFHDLRHCAATLLAQAGLSEVELATILGHRTLRMVRRYTHLTATHTVEISRRAAQALEKTLAGTPTPTPG